MTCYICPRCNYKCKQRGDMRKHFKRKRICSVSLQDERYIGAHWRGLCNSCCSYCEAISCPLHALSEPGL